MMHWWHLLTDLRWKSNLRYVRMVHIKGSTHSVVYDVLKLTPFYKAFQVTADAPEIYMQEFWASAYVHNRSVRFKMNNKKHIIGLEQFRDILQICPRVGNKKFVEPPLEKEILIFLASLGHSGDIRKLTDYSGLSQAQILWGMYNKKNVDYAYLLWEDFIFKIENKNTKKGSAMYYPRFTKLVVNFVMEKDPSIPRRNKVNWHYARDDPMFTTINVISRNEATQLASGTIPPKTKGSKKKATTDIITQQKPPTAPKEKKSGKAKQKTSELETISEADLTEAEQLKIITKEAVKKLTSLMPWFLVQMKEMVFAPGDDEDDDGHDDDEKVQDDDEHEVDKTVKKMMRRAGLNQMMSGADFVHPKLTNSFKDTNTDLDGRDKVMTDVEDTHVTLTPVNPDGQQQKLSTLSLIDTLLQPIHGASFTCTNRSPPTLLKALEDNFSELRQTNQYAEALSSISLHVDQYLGIIMQEAVDVQVHLKSSEKPKHLHACAANLSDSGGEKILINKMEAKNSINRSDIQKQLYKALVEAYEADKILRGFKEEGQRKGNLLLQSLQVNDTKTAGKDYSTMSLKDPADQEFETGVQDEQAEEEVQHLPDWFQQPTRLPSPDHAWNKSVPAVHETVQPWLSNLAQQDPRESFDELTDSTFDFSAFVMNRLNVQTLNHLNLTSRSNHLSDITGHIKEDLVPNSMWSQTIIKYDKFALWGISHWGKKRRQFYAFATLRESAQDVYSKRRIIAVTKVEIVEWHDYKHLDWITVRRDDDVLYKFKEGDFHRLRIQDIEDMLLLLVQGKVTNLSVEERIAFNVSLRMFTRRVVIQRRVEDLQLGVESYQKKLNLTKPDTYRSNLRRQDAYTPYSDPRGFIYENKDKKNRLMRIDELHKFSDGTLDDVRTALNDRLKGIRMEYLPQTFWSQRDKANARAMIQAIDKRLKTRRIMRSLERFVGGRPYGGDLRLLQRTI
ncbi:hypothetical protein Tco_0151910 [Tanacetum coccineum]